MRPVVFPRLDAWKENMKNAIKEIGEETKGIINHEVKVTRQAPDGTIGASLFHPTKAEADQEADERIGEKQMQNKK
jgi:hypothetical protein